MRYTRWMLNLILFLAILPIAFAQQLDPQQIALIRQTAADICNTVKDASGKKTELEIQGDLKAKLAGLASKLADVGASGQGKLKQEDFQGISQEATASALKDDRSCRERVFNKMIDKIGSPQDKKSMYQNEGRKDDLRAVQSYLRYAPMRVIEMNAESVCNGIDTRSSTKELFLDDSTLRITNEKDSNTLRCESGYKVTAESSEVCTAALKDVDEVVEVWSGPSVVINCLTGDCFKCVINGRFTNILHPDWQDSSRAYSIQNTSVYVGGNDYVMGDIPRFSNFVRSLSRLISGGSDTAFCKAQPQYCDDGLTKKPSS